ncbi:hypothetical protein [Frankia sp. CcWB2]
MGLRSGGAAVLTSMLVVLTAVPVAASRPADGPSRSVAESSRSIDEVPDQVSLRALDGGGDHGSGSGDHGSGGGDHGSGSGSGGGGGGGGGDHGRGGDGDSRASAGTGASRHPAPDRTGTDPRGNSLSYTGGQIGVLAVLAALLLGAGAFWRRAHRAGLS